MPHLYDACTAVIHIAGWEAYFFAMQGILPGLDLYYTDIPHDISKRQFKI